MAALCLAHVDEHHLFLRSAYNRIRAVLQHPFTGKQADLGLLDALFPVPGGFLLYGPHRTWFVRLGTEQERHETTAIDLSRYATAGVPDTPFFAGPVSWALSTPGAEGEPGILLVYRQHLLALTFSSPHRQDGLRVQALLPLGYPPMSTGGVFDVQGEVVTGLFGQWRWPDVTAVDTRLLLWRRNLLTQQETEEVWYVDRGDFYPRPGSISLEVELESIYPYREGRIPWFPARMVSPGFGMTDVGVLPLLITPGPPVQALALVPRDLLGITYPQPWSWARHLPGAPLLMVWSGAGVVLVHPARKRGLYLPPPAADSDALPGEDLAIYPMLLWRKGRPRVLWLPANAQAAAFPRPGEALMVMDELRAGRPLRRRLLVPWEVWSSLSGLLPFRTATVGVPAGEGSLLAHFGGTGVVVLTEAHLSPLEEQARVLNTRPLEGARAFALVPLNTRRES